MFEKVNIVKERWKLIIMAKSKSSIEFKRVNINLPSNLVERVKNYADNCWIEIIGEITKGNYHGEIPVLKITQIDKIAKPEEEFVYPPDDTYIPTAVIL